MRRILHSLTLIIAAVLGATTTTVSMAGKHIVNQSGLTFSPNAITIVQGDTVRWVWSAGSHTVTNGTGASDPSVGTLFDDPLNSSNPTFEYVFNTPGVVPYFCRPHEGAGMKGTITVDVATGVRTPLASAATLRQNYPNPFANSTEIEYVLAERASVRLRVYDARGRVVATLEDGLKSDGPHRVVWDGRTAAGASAPTGIYFYRLESRASVVTRKLVVLR